MNKIMGIGVGVSLLNENNEIYTQKVNDPIILSKLIEEYSLDYEEDYKSVA